MKIVVTAFEPFGGEVINPANEALQLLEEEVQGVKIVKLVVPTVFGKAINTIEAILEKEKPNVVICIGQAGGRADITVERIAINIDDAKMADNEGNMPVDKPIIKDGPAAYFSTLPIKKIVEKIKDHGIPASVSNSAGTFVCNHLMYGLLDTIDKQKLNTIGGFIHVPYIPQQTLEKINTPSMSLEDITRAIRCAIEVSIEWLRSKKL
ncbi:MAG: pyroglutamyl-peptidase I [Epulopiscium sp.]|nr:pyroglutamyl-peptidase I [Candidatus Epulonipiscium sp.]